MLRRDFEPFFLGTAMTISRTGPPLIGAKLGRPPKKATAALYRRGGPTSLAKTLQPPNKLTAAAGVLPPGSPNRQKGASPALPAPPPPPAGPRCGPPPAPPPPPRRT